MTSSRVGLDIGGANLKAAVPDGRTVSRPFPLWKQPDQLADALRGLVSHFPGDGLAVTMTGELCDCFETKRDGVRHILGSLDPGRSVGVWSTAGTFVTPAEAVAAPVTVAAANWHALATFVGRWVPSGPALLIDVGSTTTDIIPLRDGLPRAAGRTDPGRLRSGELVYTGARRTPVCSLLGSAGAAEFFATAHDVYIVLGRLPEEPENRDTADGRPATVHYASARLARMICADAETSTPEEITALAQTIAGVQRGVIGTAMRRVIDRAGGPPHAVITAGSGEFLALEVIAGVPELGHAARISLTEQLGAAVSTCACAYAVSHLASGT